ncbi:hypothetical protein I5G63_gp018 [Mycobacterium phage Imvubu]|uniref:Tail assembly chaperone n=1 Tax=Mycobacterium phage Imvubu TaxID=2686233 RepID=A0A6B9LJZ2_9CAUD|nr:hypothetical protein I5G63_gp018 [Mycobacterium phage Imvubu]QHB37759.1 hypothetical protein PBI_IMVUBU_18 [Mycobacterium phage Imvubu]
MATITIEGSITPASDLPRGQRRKVQDSAEVRKFVAAGFANVVDEDGEPEPAPLPEPVKAPAKSASREDWAEFLAEHTDVVTEGRNRDQLVGDYEVWLETHDAPGTPASE